MFASVESLRGAHAAIDRGYTPAMIVDEFPTTRAFKAGGITFIPCPAQTTNGEIPCVRCRLCFDDQARAAAGTGIAFAAHGQRATKLKRRLAVMRDDATDTCFAPTLACASVEWHT